MINIILALLKYYRSNSSFLTFCAGYRSHYVCNDVSIWFAYKWSKMLTKKLAPCLKRFSIFQLTKCHQKTSVFTKCPRDPQKWTIAPALSGHYALRYAQLASACYRCKQAWSSWNLVPQSCVMNASLSFILSSFSTWRQLCLCQHSWFWNKFQLLQACLRGKSGTFWKWHCIRIPGGGVLT